MYIRPTHTNGEPFSFGVSGKLWRDSLVMFDRQTQTLWSQISGEAMAGPTRGLKLKALSSTITTWSAWVERYPETQVLVKPALKRSAYAPYHQNPHRMGIAVAPEGDRRLHPKTLVYAIKHQGEAIALPFDRLAQAPLQNIELHDVPLLVFRPGETDEAVAFIRKAQGMTLVFDIGKSDKGHPRLIDLQTQSVWDGARGTCVSGPLQGQQLEAMPGTPVFWSIWSRYFPNTRIHPESE